MSNRNCFYVAAIKSVCVVKTGSLDMTGFLGDSIGGSHGPGHTIYLVSFIALQITGAK